MYILLCVAIALTAFYIFFKNGPKKGNAIPGPTGLPIVGYAYKMKRETVHELFFEQAQKYGGIFHINSIGQNVIILNSADMVRSIFCDQSYTRFTNDRPKLFWGEWVLFRSKSALTSTETVNSPHGDLRKKFARGMHAYGEGITAFEENVHSELLKINGKIDSFNGKEFDMQTLVRDFLYNIISILLSGQPIGDSDADWNMFLDFDRGTDYLFRPDVNLILSMFPSLRLVPGAYKKAFDEIIHARDALLQRYFYDAKNTCVPGQIRGLVDCYIKEQLADDTSSCDDEQICATVLDTVAAGVLTILSHLTSYFICLLNYPEYQTKIQEEIDRVIGTDRHPTLSDKKSCVFMEAVTLEVHRFITTVPIPAPRMCRPNMEFQGYDIPANSIIFTNAWFIHHDTKIWGDPWTFRPERWIDDDGALLPNDHVLRKNWLAFGTGRRQCLGESLAMSRSFLFVATLLQRWNFEMPPEHAVSCDPRDETMDVDITCRPKAYLCRAVPRKRV